MNDDEPLIIHEVEDPSGEFVNINVELIRQADPEWLRAILLRKIDEGVRVFRIVGQERGL